MEFGFDMTSSGEEATANHTEQQNTAELSDRDMALLSSMHCSLFIQLVSSNWFHGDKSLLPKVNFVRPYLLAYRSAAVLIRHCAHVLGN